MDLILKIANLIAFFFLLSVNVYSGLAPVKDDDLLFLSLIVILIIACQVTHIYHQLYYVHRYDKRLSWKYAFIHLPFTLYHAWIVVVAVLTTFATITPEKTYSTTDRSSTETANSPNIIVQLVVILGLLFLESTAVAYIEAREDYAGGAVIAWTLYGVWYEQEDPVIHWSALILAIIATIYLFKPLVAKIFGRDGKQEPV
ncbi:20398_t:CDS:2 [Gigaspora margarita]|uniref:20398_t:CDS:1 n=1 Tax=Gigaspora margarita TaxID=4874 RepID=A0ABN7V0G8_GIGMA|nr:20398_t:CDS:2 [Gigaspora margarita]